MKARVILSASAAVCALAAAAIALGQDGPRPLLAAMSDDAYLACGLDKLTTDEQESLMGLIAGGPAGRMADEAARHYMEKEGWRRVRVVGAITVGKEKQIVLLDQYDVHFLKPFIVPQLPEPGIYWAKSVVSSYTLLYPDATQGSFNGVH